MSIPEDANYITWLSPRDLEQRIAFRYGHHANRVWRMGAFNLSEEELVESFIGSALVTVLTPRVEDHHQRLAIYDGNEHVCATCPTNAYGERVAWDQAHPTVIDQMHARGRL